MSFLAFLFNFIEMEGVIDTSLLLLLLLLLLLSKLFEVAEAAELDDDDDDDKVSELMIFSIISKHV